MLRANHLRQGFVRTYRPAVLAMAIASVSLFSGSTRAGTAVSWDRQANGQTFTENYLDGDGKPQTYTYTWPDNANWSQSKALGSDPAGNQITTAPSNWSQDTYPDGDYDVSLGGDQVTDNISVSVDTLNLSGELDILGGVTLSVTQGSLINNGKIVVDWDTSAYGTALNFTSDATISGTGQIVLNNDGAAAQLNAANGSTVTIGSGQTISGLGQMSGTFINNGVIRGDVAASVLSISGTMTNNGQINPIDGGTVSFNGTMTNDGSVVSQGGLNSNSSLILTGTINNSTDGLVGAGGNLYLEGVAIDGGQVLASNAYAYVQVGGNSSITNAQFDLGEQDKMDILSGNTFTFGGVMNLRNDGTITVDSDNGPYGTALNFDADITVNGIGDILLTQPGTVSQFNTTSGATVTLGADQTLHGTGQISAAIINKGTISADVVGQSLNIGSYAIENDNLMQANNQSVMNINSITVTNTSGQISASNQSAVVIAGATIDGGTVSATSDSYIEWNASTMSGAITLSGTQNIPNGTTTTMNGSSLTNNGTIFINPEQGIYGTALNFDSDATLNGSGEILLDSAGGAAQLNVINAYTLTVQSGQIIDGMGQISGDIVNNGEIIAKVSGQTLSISPSTDISNYGTLAASDGGILQLTNGQFDNYGGISSAADSTLTLLNATVSNQPTGALSISGALVFTNSTINGGTTDASASGASVLVNGNSTIENTALTLGGGDYLNILTGFTLTFDGAMNLTNNGSIVVNADNGIYGTALNFNSDITIGGTGDILLTQPGAVSQFNTTNGATVTLGSGQTLHGTGQVNGAIINHGVINADVNGKSLDMSSYALENDNVVEATNQSTLNLNYVQISNSGGQITASNQSTVAITGSTVDGGIVSASADSQVNWSSSTMSGAITLSGTQNIIDSTITTMNGSTLTNNGKIIINHDGSIYGTALNFDADVSLDGSGEILLNSAGAAAQLNVVNSHILTIGSNQLIDGEGQISGTIVNDGIIRADVSGKSMSMSSYALENDNVVEATNQSTLNLNYVQISNSGGQITASNQSTVAITGSTVDGGIVSASADSQVNWSSSTMSGAITLSGTQNIIDSTITTVNGPTLTNNGKIIINHDGGIYGTALNFDADVSLDGSGEILLNSAGAAAQINVINGHTLTIQAGQVVDGEGWIGGDIVNYGQMTANVAGQTLQVSPATDFSNYGTLSVTGGARLLLNGQFDNFTTIGASGGSSIAISNSTINGGAVTASADSHVNWTNSTMSGAITLSGTQNIIDSTITTVNGPTLTNNGKIIVNDDGGIYGTALNFDADVSLDGSGEILLNSAGAAAQLNVLNSHTLTIGSHQLIHGEGQIGGTIVNNGTIRADVASQKLEISGDLTNNGTLNLAGGVLRLDQGLDNASVIAQLDSGFAGGAWNGSGIISSLAASHRGTAVGYTNSGASYTLMYTWLGDTNLDGVVNSDDLDAISPTGTTWATGDFNYDGLVNADDYALFALGSALGSTNISTTLPEPSIPLLAASCYLGISVVRSRRNRHLRSL